MSTTRSLFQSPGIAARIACRVAAACLLLAQISCRNEREQAVHELELRSLKADAAALANAVARQQPDILDLLDRAGVKVPEPPPGELSLLQQAATAGSWEIAQRLISMSAPAVLDQVAPTGRTLLDDALSGDQPGVAAALLQAGARPEKSEDGGAAALKAAEPSPVFPALVAALPEKAAVLAPALLRAIAAGNGRNVRLLLERGADPNARADGVAALDLACVQPWPEIARALLAHGADATPAAEGLHQAVEHGDLDLCRLLLAAGAPPEAAPHGESPLQAAIRTRHIGIVDLLLQTGVDPTRYAAAAVTSGDRALLDVFFSHGLEASHTTESGDTLLDLALDAQDPSLIPVLLEKGADLHAPGALGQPPLVMASLRRQMEAMRLLLAAGADPNQVFLSPVKPEIFPLADNEHFQTWLKRDKDLTPLMLAASRGDTAMLRLLLDSGAKRGRQTREWKRYPIQFACDTVNIPAAQMLLGRNPADETSRTHVRISLSKQRAYLYKDDKLLRSSSVSTGRKGNRTPSGKFVITDKQVDWVSSIYKVPMPYFMRLSCRDFGMHAGVVPGYPASHGCIRMPKSEVQAFYRVLKIGDPVTIED